MGSGPSCKADAVSWAWGRHEGSWLDPCAGREIVRKDADPAREALAEVISAWETSIGLKKPITAKKLIEVSADDPALAEALAETTERPEVTPRSLGAFLRSYKGRNIGGLRINAASGSSREGKKWVLEEA